jgi:Zn-dependent protease
MLRSVPGREVIDVKAQAGDDGPFRAAVPLGHVVGVRVSAHWSVLLILMLLADSLAVVVFPEAAPHANHALYWFSGMLTAVAFLGSLLAHELAHAIVARRFGMKVERITLWLLGGMTDLGGDPPSPRAEALIAASGPGTSMAIGMGSLGVAWALGSTGLLAAAAGWLGLINIVLGVFNLLPGAPLDGGRLLRALLWRHFGDRSRATDVSSRAGRGLGAGLMVFGFLQFASGALAWLWFALLGWFIFEAASSERAMSSAGRLRGLTARDVMHVPPAVVASWWTVADFVNLIGPEHAGRRTFATVDFDGRPVALVALPDLTRVPDDQRQTTRIRDIARPRPGPLTVTPETPLSEIVLPIHLHGGIAVVVDAERAVGTIYESDLFVIGDLARLGRFGHEMLHPVVTPDQP